MKITAEQVDEMTRGYITAALWTDCTPCCDVRCDVAQSGEHIADCPANESGGLERLDVDERSRRYVWALCRYFADLYAVDLERFATLRECRGEGTVWDYIGHDLRLTSAGHGTGFWDREPQREDWAHVSPLVVDEFMAARAALTTASQLAPFSRIGGGDCFQTDEDTACIDVGLDAALFRQRAIAQGYADPETGEPFSSAQRQHWVETGEIDDEPPAVVTYVNADGRMVDEGIGDEAMRRFASIEDAAMYVLEQAGIDRYSQSDLGELVDARRLADPRRPGYRWQISVRLRPQDHHPDCDYRLSSAAHDFAQLTGVDVEENSEIYPCNLGCETNPNEGSNA